jgi:N,N'-diacetyllegionaminate synthase
MYTILEVANTHAGNIDYIYRLIDEFKPFDKNHGIKFQPFRYCDIALEDFEWYPVYEKLFFDEKEWDSIITKANETKDIWLDLFDIYGIKILKNHLSKVKGIKLQSSVLENLGLLEELQQIDLSQTQMVINIAGREMADIERLVTYFEASFTLKELLLEVGFQSYPTQLMDSGLTKIQQIKDQFNKKIVFADHVDGRDKNALTLPLTASLMGADVIEKHIMHSELETEYDHFSSIKVEQYTELHEMFQHYHELMDQPFINTREEEYLSKTLQIPILRNDKKAGSFLTLKELDFKRTSQKGMNLSQVKAKLAKGYVLSKDKSKNESIATEDLRKAKVASIIAVRLKSSRLKEKAKLNIGSISSIELCIKNTLRFKGIDHTIVATSDLEQDRELENYTYNDQVIFHTGDPEDVIQRYLDIIREKEIDTIVRITGDMPYVSADIASFLLEEHFKSGADYTVGEDAAVGMNLEIINTAALEKVKSHFPSADYSEYMTWYFQNNPEHFNLNFVALPEKWVRKYRLTLDYAEDLELFNIIEAHFEKNNIDFNIDELFNYLDNNPETANMNGHIGLKYKTDQELIDRLNKYTKI